MRITNSMLISKFLSNIDNNMSVMDKYSTQIETKKKISRISDDTISLVYGMSARQKLNTTKQHEDNLSTARSWVDSSETALLDISETLATIRENLISASTDKNNSGDKENYAKLIKEFKDHIFQSLNSSVGFKHIFAGYNTTQQPFTIDEASGNVLYNGIDLTTATQDQINEELAQNFQIEIGVGLNMDITFTGAEIVGIGENNMFKVLDDLVNALENNADAQELSSYLGKIDNVSSTIMEKIVTVGTRTNKIDMLENRYSLDNINNEGIRSTIEDIDEAEAIMNFKMAESIYNQALAVGAKIIVPTLLDYVR